jgi:fumarylpyruvate hydrolase
MNSKPVFSPAPAPIVTIVECEEVFPVRRIYCVGRNYDNHVREMGGDPKKDPPIFFTKPANAVVASGTTIPYPLATSSLHHEVELVVALDASLRKAPAHICAQAIFGFAVGVDLTRRDLQAEAKGKCQPWDCAKAFDQSAPIGSIQKVDNFAQMQTGNIELAVNGSVRQQSDLDQMIWSIPEILSALSHLFELRAGDLIFTGTPAGVGPLVPGDQIVARIDGLPELSFEIGV